MTARAKPPFRADHVGSLLRSAPLKQARAERDRGKISATDLREIEDREIENIIRKQEAIGLKLATDGEYRRSWWHFDFLEHLDGVEAFVPEHGIQFHGVETKPKAVRVVEKIGFSGHPMLEHFRFLKTRTRVVPKMTIPSPSVLHFRSGRNGISKQIYPDIEQFFEDLADTYRKVVRAFADVGCRYLQLDDTVWAYLCSAEQRAQARSRGDDPDKLPAIYADVINHAIAGRPHDMVITTHSCRGNFRSTWIAEGGYEPIAEVLLGRVDFDGYFLEYDTERAGGFEPLRFLPKGDKIVVLGLVTSKTGTLEQKDDVKRRIEEAAKYAPMEQLALSPQCGFSSTVHGNNIAVEDQRNKLRLVVETAREMWGEN